MSVALLEQQALKSLDLEIGQLDRVLEALAHRDLELAELVVAEGERLDDRYLEVHQGIVSHLAMQRPVATDVRLVAVLLHVIKHVERIGDQCVNVAKLIAVCGRASAVRLGLLSKLVQMGQSVRLQVLHCKRAFAERDIAMAEELVALDRDVNRLNREIFCLAVHVGDDADAREWAMTMILIARALERIGDNAVDIGEQTAFAVTGLFREFSGATHVGRH
jgi:phosphate transport system protein